MNADLILKWFNFIPSWIWFVGIVALILFWASKIPGDEGPTPQKIRHGSPWLGRSRQIAYVGSIALAGIVLFALWWHGKPQELGTVVLRTEHAPWNYSENRHAVFFVVTNGHAVTKVTLLRAHLGMIEKNIAPSVTAWAAKIGDACGVAIDLYVNRTSSDDVEDKHMIDEFSVCDPMNQKIDGRWRPTQRPSSSCKRSPFTVAVSIEQQDARIFTPAHLFLGKSSSDASESADAGRQLSANQCSLDDIDHSITKYSNCKRVESYLTNTGSETHCRL